MDDLRIYAIHQAVQRQFRNDVAAEMIKSITELSNLQIEELSDKIEDDAAEFEDKFVSLFRSENWDDDIPVIDFENNGTVPKPTKKTWDHVITLKHQIKLINFLALYTYIYKYIQNK